MEICCMVHDGSGMTPGNMRITDGLSFSSGTTAQYVAPTWAGRLKWKDTELVPLYSTT